MNKKRWLATWLVLCLVFAWCPTTTAHAEGVQNTFITNTNQTLTPMSSRHEYFLQVSPRWQVRQAEFTIHFRHSATLLRDLSSVSLLVDGVPYKTAWLSAENQSDGTLSAQIPASALPAGFHQFSVATNLRSHRELCDDLTDPANWLVLDKSSLIHLDFADRSVTPELQMFPVPFLNESGSGPWNVNIVVPDTATDRELTVAYRMVNLLAKHQPLQASSARVIKLTDWQPQTDARNLIVVGQIEKLPAGWQKRLQDLPSTGRDVGLLREVISPEEGKRTVLYVTGHTERGVEMAAEALTFTTFRQQLSGSTAEVSEDLLTAAQALQEQEPDALQTATSEGRVTLQQLGYNEITLSNVQTSSAGYTFQTPPMWHYTRGAGVKLHMKYSALLDDKRSAVIATVNGSPQVSAKLAKQTAEGLDLFVPFPETMRVGEAVRVSVQAEMYLETNECADSSTPAGLRRYLSIDPEKSEFVLPHMQEETAALANFPGAFLSETSTLEQTTAVLPSQPTSAEMISLAQIVAGAAQGVEHDGLEVVRYHSDAQLRQKVWVLDTAGDNEFLQVMAEHRELAIRSTPEGLQSDTIPLVNTTQSKGGAIQQVFRPQGGIALVVIAPTAEMLMETAKVLAERTDISGAVQEAAAIRTADQQTVLVKIDTQPYRSLPERVVDKLRGSYGYLRSSEGQLVVFATAFGITVLAILGYIWRLILRPKLRRRKKPWKPKPPSKKPDSEAEFPSRKKRGKK
ncbi:cellulose biosynthesis cyclic di-GMP-binding regulatory protein BcsB [Tumebacillus permanentifrigoris]|uniref:Cellulose synthase subunit n=1 Tax=Tumebacillus permanentifrigoris TaxID=378543 RepID=A0A316DEC6_9BACL|nr:cellulose biosynthesis cyclic di-GMP-binding regulatory protein BcsB [Tumebacillus permanentifrigoris]PWK16551.1 cellulose synthase subunit [Tumebacillus permanentifrigoris]